LDVKRDAIQSGKSSRLQICEPLRQSFDGNHATGFLLMKDRRILTENTDRLESYPERGAFSLDEKSSP